MATVWTDNCFDQKTPTLISDDETQTFLANITQIFEEILQNLELQFVRQQ